MENQRFLSRKCILPGVSGLISILLLKGCFLSCVPAHEMLFRDEHGRPIEGVLVSYSYSGTGAFNGYGKPGGIVVADSAGRVEIPKAIFFIRPFDSDAVPVVHFVYSDRMHAGGIVSSSSLGSATGFYRPSDPLHNRTEVILSDFSKSPIQWFFCLIDLANVGREQAGVGEMWRSEKKKFLDVFGRMDVPAECIQQIEKYHGPYSNAYRKSVREGKKISSFGDLLEISEIYEY